MYNRIRLTPEQRKIMILETAVKEALDHGLYRFSIANVSRRLENTSKSTIRGYFGNIKGLRIAIVEEARAKELAEYGKWLQQLRLMKDV